MLDFDPLERPDEAIDWLSSNSDVRVVVGPPGCGKTYYLTHKASEAAARLGPSGVIVASLTRAAAAAATASRLPLPKKRIATLHSHAFQALSSPDLAETPEALADFSGQVDECFRLKGSRDLETASGASSGSTPGDRLLEKYRTLRAALTPRERWPDGVTKFAALWESWKEAEEKVDFEDLIETAIRSVPHAPGQPRVIYVDEAQDHCKSEFLLALLWGHAAAAIVFVGDPNQTIFEFRGADPDCFRRLNVPPEKRRVLSLSYRVPPAIREYSQAWLRRVDDRDDSEYFPLFPERPESAEAVPAAYEEYLSGERAEFGQVTLRPELQWDKPGPVADEIERSLDADRDVMVLTTCGYMLDKLRRVLDERGVTYHNPYSPNRGQWNPYSEKLKYLKYLRVDAATYGEHARPWMWKELWSWFELIAARFLQRGMKAGVERMAKDPTTREQLCGDSTDDALETVVACFAEERQDEAREKLRKDLFWEHIEMALKKPPVQNLRPGKKREVFQASIEIPPECFFAAYSKRGKAPRGRDVRVKRGGRALLGKPRVIVGTTFSVKGGESDDVLVFPDVSPEAARQWQSTAAGAARTRDSLRRLFYVAFTRGKRSLIIGGPSTRRFLQLPAP